MRWLRLQFFSMSAGLKLWLDEPLNHLFNALVLAIALAMPWATTQGLSALIPALDHAVGNPEISLYFRPSASLNAVQSVSAKLQREPDLADITTITPEEALEKLRAQSQTPDLASALPNNPLPYTIVAQLDVDAKTNPQAIEDKIAQWKTYRDVEHVQYDAQWVRRLQSMLHSMQLLAASLGVVIAVLVLVVTFNTVRLQLVRNQTEVRVLKALGATDGQVGRPTLWWAISLAVVAFSTAYGMVTYGMTLADEAVGQWIRQFDAQFHFTRSGVKPTLMLGGAWTLLVIIGAWASVKSTVLRIR